MKQSATRLALVFLGSLAIAAGCSSSAPPTTGSGGQTGAGAGGNAHLVPLMPDGDGFVSAAGSGTTNITGAWYAYGDGVGMDGTSEKGDCELKGSHPATACSRITMPTVDALPNPFPNTMGKMCTAGTAAKVIDIVGSAGMADYNNVWGAGIGLDLNNPGGDAGAMKQTYNATTNGVVGIAFDIDNVPLGTLRVEFPTATNTNAPFWGGTMMASPVHIGHNEIRWAEVQGPFFDMAALPFDPKTIYSIQLHVPTSTASSSDYQFCVSNVSAIIP